MFISCEECGQNWKGYTLVVPAVSVGNVGQLTADLLISTLWMNKVGYFFDDSVLPVVGNDPYATDESKKSCQLSTAVEVYESADHKILTIQQRAPFVKGKKKQFVAKLINWIQDNLFKEVVILTSSYAHERRDQQLMGTQLRFLSSPSLDGEVGSVLRNNLGWLGLEKRTPAPGAGPALPSEAGDIFIPGGGLAKDLFQECCAQNLKAVVLLIFCAEGDNMADSLELATYLNSWKSWVDLKKSAELNVAGQKKDGWRIPSSWKHLFGSTFSQMLFQ